MSKKNTVAVAGGQEISGTDIVRGCAEVILEHAPEGNRKRIESLKQSMLEFSHLSGKDMAEIAIATITATVGKQIDAGCVKEACLTHLEKEDN